MTNIEMWAVFARYFLAPILAFVVILALFEFAMNRWVKK